MRSAMSIDDGCVVFFFQAEDGIRDFCLSRGLGDVYKRQTLRELSSPWPRAAEVR
ncbi:hypothetical protein CDFC105_03974 [Clostridioides difficile]|nr:hypothetical protein CDFC105_03974 [Clostridioides difficile]